MIFSLCLYSNEEITTFQRWSWEFWHQSKEINTGKRNWGYIYNQTKFKLGLFALHLNVLWVPLCTASVDSQHNFIAGSVRASLVIKWRVRRIWGVPSELLRLVGLDCSDWWKYICTDSENAVNRVFPYENAFCRIA